MSGDWVEPVLISIGVALYASYHGYLVIRAKRRPWSTTIGQNHYARRRWCQIVVAERRDLLAVQTIRNSMMAASLLASTSITLSSVVAAYLVNTIINSEKGLAGIDLLASTWLVPVHKYLAIISTFTIAFICYMQSVRSGTHASYLIAIPKGALRYVTPEYTALVLQRGADFHTAGTRLFYLSFVLVLWLFGPIPPLILCCCMVPFLFYLDCPRDCEVHREEQENNINGFV